MIRNIDKSAKQQRGTRENICQGLLSCVQGGHLLQGMQEGGRQGLPARGILWEGRDVRSRGRGSAGSARQLAAGEAAEPAEGSGHPGAVRTAGRVWERGNRSCWRIKPEASNGRRDPVF